MKNSSLKHLSCLIHCNNSLDVIFSFLEALQKIIFPKFLHFEMLPQKHLRLKVKLIHLQIACSEKNKTYETTGCSTRMKMNALTSEAILK